MNDERNGNGDEVGPSAFDHLLETEELFYRTVSRHLARLAAGIGVPPCDVKDVVAEAWLDGVCFASVESGKLLCSG
jgi:hypothetical protein